MNVIDLLKREQEKQQVPVLRSGDTVRVHVKVVEGTRERIQVFEGVVIALKGKVGLATSFTVRRIAHGVGVERTFLVHAPASTGSRCSDTGRSAARSCSTCARRSAATPGSASGASRSAAPR